LPGAGFHDFKWYTVEIDDIYYIGGFGGIHYIGWIDVATYYGAENLSSSTKLLLDEMDLESVPSSLLLQRQ